MAPAGAFLFASNAGSADVSGFTSSAGGQLTLLGATGTDAGTVDASAAAGGRFLYVQTGGAGIVDEFSVTVPVPSPRAGLSLCRTRWAARGSWPAEIAS